MKIKEFVKNSVPYMKWGYDDTHTWATCIPLGITVKVEGVEFEKKELILKAFRAYFSVHGDDDADTLKLG